MRSFPSQYIESFKLFLNTVQKRPPRGVIIFLIVFVLIGLQNSFEELFFPTLHDEDGSIIFTTFYNEHTLKNIFTFHLSYILTLPMALGYLAQFFPIKAIPYIYVGIALIIKSLSCFLFYRVIGRLYQSEGLAWYILLAVSILPLAGLEFSVSLSHQIWNFLLILFLLLFLPIPKKITLKIPFVLAVILMTWSNPGSILLVPLYGFKLFADKVHRWEYSLFIIAAGSYALFGIESQSPNFSGLQYFVEIFRDRVVVDSLLGLGIRSYLQYLEITGWLAAFVLAVIFLRLFFTWQHAGREEKEFIVGLCFMAVFLVLVSLAGRPDYIWKFYHQIGGGIRYVYISKTLMVALVLVALFYQFKNSTGFHGVFPGVSAVFFYIQSGNFVYYKTDIEVSEKVTGFIDLLSKKNSQCYLLDRKFLYLNNKEPYVSESPGKWRIKASVCP